MTFNRMLLVILILVVTGLGLLVVDSAARDEECKRKGGTTISTPQGRMCAKIERL